MEKGIKMSYGWDDVYDYDYTDTTRCMAEQYLEDRYIEEQIEERSRNEARI